MCTTLLYGILRVCQLKSRDAIGEYVQKSKLIAILIKRGRVRWLKKIFQKVFYPIVIVGFIP